MVETNFRTEYPSFRKIRGFISESKEVKIVRLIFIILKILSLLFCGFLIDDTRQ